jgi:transporter family-2 protein
MVVVIGLIGGLAVGTQAPIAGVMAQRVGGASSSFIVHIGGALVSGLLLLARRGENIQDWRELPWYMLGVGVFGLVLYLSVSHTIPRVGAAAAITLIIVGQLLAGIVIDHVGAFGITVREVDSYRLGGGVLLLAGAYLIVR